MVFKKLSKKIMAYTLTTAMALGFFAVSDINLTTAWALAAVTAIQSQEGDVVLDTAAGNTVTASGTLAHNISVTGTINAEIEIGSYTLTMGATNTITTGDSQSIIIKQNGTAKYTIGASTVLTGVKISADGITGGRIAGGTITGGTITGTNLSGGVAVASAATGGANILKNCTLTGGDLTAEKPTTSGTNTVKIEGTFATDSTSRSLKIGAAGSGNAKYEFNNATVSGKLNFDTSTDPVVTGTFKGEELTLTGEPGSGSAITMTVGDSCSLGTSASVVTTQMASALSCKFGSNFIGGLVVYPIVPVTGNAEGGGAGNLWLSTEAFKYISSDEANLEAAMKAGKVKIAADATLETTPSAPAYKDNCCAHLQDGAFTYGIYDFDYEVNGRNVAVTVKAKGDKYDGVSFTLPVKSSVEHMGVTPNSSDNQFSKLEYVADFSKIPSTVNSVIKSALKTKVILNDTNKAGVGDTSTVKFCSEGTAYNSNVDGSLGFTVAKRDISSAVLNGLHANGLDGQLTLANTTVTAPSVPTGIAKDGFVSVEFAAGATSVGKSNLVTSENIPNLGGGSENIYLAYYTAAGKLKYEAMTATNFEFTTEPQNSVGDHTVTVAAKAGSTHYKGSVSIPYTVVDAKADDLTYNGSLQEISGLTGANEFSLDGTNFTTTVPKFKDAGTYKFKYKVANDTTVKSGVVTVKPATVTANWNGNDAKATYTYDGNTKTRKITSISGSAALADQFDLSGVTYKYYNYSDGADRTVAIDSCENVGKYKVVAQLTDKNKNFKLSNPSSNGASEDIEITPAEVSINSKDNIVAYYDGKDHSIGKVTIKAPEGSYKVMYGTESGSYTSETAPAFREKGTHKVYYQLSKVATYNNPTDPLNYNLTSGAAGTTGYVTLTIKDALTVKITEPTKDTLTYTGKNIPVKATAYCGDTADNDVKVELYARKDKGSFEKITDGIKEVGTYTFKYKTIVNGEESDLTSLDDIITIKAAPKKNLKNATASAKAVTYNANKQTAKVTVKYGKTTLKLNKDYTLKNATHINAGSFKVTITGKGNYTGTKTVTFKIAKRKVTKGVVTVKRNKKTFTVYVKIGKKNYKVAKTNYKLTAKYNKKTKKYAVTVAFKVNYSGTVKKTVK